MKGLQAFDGVQRQCDAGFHIERAWAPGAAVGHAERHGCQRSDGIDGVEVAEEQHGFAATLAGEIDLQVVAELFRAVKPDVSAEIVESPRQNRAQAIDRLLCVAGRFDFHQLLDGLNHVVLVLCEMVQGVLLHDQCRGSGTPVLWSRLVHELFCVSPSPQEPVRIRWIGCETG